MFKRLFKNKKAQNTAEYALLISLVVAAVIAMQTYAQRAIQARIRGASIYMANQTSALGNTTQYEAYYQSSDYDVDRESTETTTQNNTTMSVAMDESRSRNGVTGTSYDTSVAGLINGI
jgi:Flp pilus assembly pilin Flp